MFLIDAVAFGIRVDFFGISLLPGYGCWRDIVVIDNSPAQYFFGKCVAGIANADQVF